MRLLSIDWDYFFPKVERPEDQRWPGELWFYDWGHHESPIMIREIWGTRGADFLYAGKDLPGTTGEERDWWARFSGITPKARTYIAESHAMIVHPRVLDGITEIWSYDAHHDAGYKDDAVERMAKKRTVFADDWAIMFAHAGIPVHVRYPRWRAYAMEEETPRVEIDRAVDDGAPVLLPFDRVFICRSGAWTPPWIDADFEEFVARCPVGKRRSVGSDLVDRSGWRESAEKLMEARRTLERLHDEAKQAGITVEELVQRKGDVI